VIGDGHSAQQHTGDFMSLIDSPVHNALRQASLRIAKRLENDHIHTNLSYSIVQQIALIQQIFKTMTAVPYGVKHNVNIDAIGLGREVYRLFDHNPELTESVVIEAFNLVGTPNGVNTPVFPVGNVSPAARRLIIQDPFFQGAPTVPWAVYCSWIGEDERRRPIVKAENELIGYPNGVFMLRLSPGIEDVDGIWRTFDLN
jgi:hypothetical protein